MKKIFFLFIQCVFCFQHLQAEEASKADILPDYVNLFEVGSENWLEIAGILGGITFLGAKEWEWGSSSFKFNDEGWFGMDSGSGGADKLGHLYSSYVMSEFLTYSMSKKGFSRESSAKYSAYISWSLMLYVEIFDGFSSDHGFSNEDLIANTTGIGVSYLKSKYPDTFGDTIDLRIEYSPSDGMDGFHPVTDYSGMKYLAVGKLSGLDLFKNTSFKYIEVQLGYYSRGFKEEDRPYTDYKTTETFVGIGLNLSELIFKPNNKTLGKVGEYVDTITQYVQVPGISMRENIHSRSQLATQ